MLIGNELGGFGTLHPNLLIPTQNYINAMAVRPDDTKIAKINTLIGTLITAGIWTKFDLFYLLNMHTAQAAHLNLVEPGRGTITPVSSPTFTANVGYAGNGTSAYLNTGILQSALFIRLEDRPAQFDDTPAFRLAQFVQNSAHMGCWSNTDSDSNNNFGIGLHTSSISNIRTSNATGSMTGRINHVADTTFGAVAASTGHFVINRSGASATQAYRNGASVGSGTDASTAPVASLVVGLESNGVFSAQQISIMHVGGSLTAGNVTSLHSALSTYLA